VVEWFTQLFDTSGFPPRWSCGSWTAALGWLHILSDLGIWSAYVAIPCVLGYFLLCKKDLPFRTIFLLFGAFILACGTTHLMEAIIFWWPAYRLAGVIKLLTALVSWGTVVALIPVTPRGLAMRSPEEMEREIAERRRAEQTVRQLNTKLEQRVEERTAELVSANEALRAAVVEREQTQEALREQRERFRALLASIGDGVIATDAEGRVTFLNPVAESMTGWAQSDAAGQPLETVFQVVEESTRRPVESPAVRALREGSTSGLAHHTLLIGRDGSERPVDDTAAPIRSEAGGLRGVVLVFRDATERQRAERAVRESEQRFAGFMQHLPGLAWIKDRQGRYVFANDAAEKAFQTPRDHLYGRTDDEIFPPETAAKFKENDQQARASGAGVQVIETLAHEDGVLHHSLVSKFPIPGPDGTTALVGGMAIDITDRLRAEEALKEADRHKDEFLAMLAHELRNPLAPIRNALHVMKQPTTDPTINGQVRDMAERQVRHMARLLDDLLDVARISQGRIKLHQEPLDLSSLVSRTTEAVRSLIDDRHHELTVSLASGPLWVEGDATRLEQVLTNLLTNACKYTDPGGRLWVGAMRENDEIVLRVCDTGIGITAEMLPRVFDLFVQVERRLDRSQGGVGIGLTLVKRLVEMHGGTVRAISPGLGKGSEFVVHLPALARARASEEARPKGDTPVTTPSRRILIVDDNPDAADTLALLLRLGGQEVEVAYDGPTGLARAREFQPAVILLDIGMPGMDGYEVARRLRREPALGATVLVALTGWGQEEDRRRGREAGFDHHLVKPVEPRTLQNLLAEMTAPVS
jgi:PAS domain S-box-containing protein